MAEASGLWSQVIADYQRKGKPGDVCIGKVMAARESLWLFVGLAINLSAGAVSAQTFGQLELLSTVDVEDVVQDEPAGDSMRLVEPQRDTETGIQTRLEPSALEDLSGSSRENARREDTAIENADPAAKERSDSRSISDGEDSTGKLSKRTRETQRRSETTLSQLDKLNTPLNQIQLSGLESEDGPASLAEQLAASANGHARADVRWITASADGSGAVTSETTHYARRPLYFENTLLERCGRSDDVFGAGIWTNGKSAAKFLVDTTLLPYRMIRQRPDKLVSVRAK